MMGSERLALVDVGARGGLKSPWGQMPSNLLVIGFEPEEKGFQALAKQNGEGRGVVHQMHPYALWDSEANLKLHVTRGPGKSSLFRPNQAYLRRFTHPERYDVVEEFPLRTKTLDEILRDRPEGADFIKIDCQGADLNVLRGAERTLRESFFGVEVEVWFNRVYSDAPLFADVDAYLRGLGFSLFDLRLLHWKREAGLLLGGAKGQAVFADALYFRDGEQAFRFHDRTRLLSAFVICHLYGYYDFLRELALANRALLSGEEWERLEGALAATSSGIPLKGLPGRRRMLRLLWKSLKRFSSPFDSSHNVTNALGNRFD
jgi:FkbM family methyltransferase